MAFNLNEATIAGNVGRDPEIRNLNGDRRMATLSVATGERYKDKKSGEFKTDTEWHRVVIYNVFLVKLVEERVKKGSNIWLRGQIKTRKFTDQAGVEKTVTEIVLPNFGGDIKLLDSASKGEDNKRGSGGSKSGGNPAYDLDDDIPF